MGSEFKLILYKDVTECYFEALTIHKVKILESKF